MVICHSRSRKVAWILLPGSGMLLLQIHKNVEVSYCRIRMQSLEAESLRARKATDRAGLGQVTLSAVVIPEEVSQDLGTSKQPPHSTQRGHIL